MAVAAAAVHARQPIAPDGEGCAGQSQLRRVVVHHYQVAHARMRGAAGAVVYHQYLQPALAQFVGAGRAHNARADDDSLSVHAAC